MAQATSSRQVGDDVTDRSGGLTDAANAEPHIEVGLATDVGQVRTGNEDSILCEPLESLLVSERGLFCAVADGMGGHAAGEDASSMAVKVARDAFYGADAAADPKESLRLAVAQANAAVYDAGAGKTGRDHMGTTLTAAVVFNHRVVVGHVGDSRCYRIRGDKIQQLTRDHSLVSDALHMAPWMTEEEIRRLPPNVITRALGIREDVLVDLLTEETSPGDIYLLCSDGLSGLVSDNQMREIVTAAPSLDEACRVLIERANFHGGTDNITVVLARVEPEP
jgi:serine/threonine protein phosphatase PrpC